MTIDAPRPPLAALSQLAGGALVAIYDLSVSPLTFDIMPFLVAAEAARLSVGAPSIHFVVIPAEAGSHYGNLGVLSEGNLAWRARQIVVPATALMPSVRAVSVVETRAAAGELLGRLQGPRYPEYYAMERPIAGFSVAEVEATAFAGAAIPSLAASSQARAYIARWLATHAGGRKPVSVTLREADNATGKNNDRAAWSAFVAGIDTSIYFPFLIRDTDRVFDTTPPEFSNVAQFPLAAVNLELRAAAYELSYLNLVGGSGPILLCLFDANVKCLIFNLGTPGWADTVPDAFRKNYGIEPGRQLRHATPYQRLVWAPDNAETIRRHFDLMVRYIEGGEAALRDPIERAFILAEHEEPSIVADRLFAGRQWGPAKTLYRHLLSGQPERAEWAYRLGVAETWAGNARQGMASLQRAADLGLETAGLFLARCEALLFLGRTDQAIASARYALELDPDNFDAALRLGLIYEAHNDLDEAGLWIERAIAIRPASDEARLYMDAVRARRHPQAVAR